MQQGRGMAAETGRESRWKNEVGFFHPRGERLLRQLGPLPPSVVRRYLGTPRRRYSKEFRFRLLGDLRGTRVLDVGCGDGFNSVLLAKAGAEVTALDLTPSLIEVAQRRAQIEGVAERMRFLCGPIESVELPPRHFDVIWGDGILHHVIDELPAVLEKLARVGKLGALGLFSEPVALSPAIRALRKRLPIHSEATPDERPLEPPELATLRRFLPDLRSRHFFMLGRLAERILGGKYEDARAERRLLCDAIHALDYGLLSLRPVQPLGGLRVMWGHFSAGPH